MVKNKNGFTLIELLATIVIASIIIAPLMYSLVSYVTTNAEMHTRRNSVSLAESAIYGFDKLSFTDLQNLYTASTSRYVEFDATTCNQLTLETNDQAICEKIFESTFNNVSFDENHFKVYILKYNVSDDIGILLLQGLEPEIITEIQSYTESAVTTDLLRVLVWIDYGDKPNNHTVVSGLLIGNWTDSIYGD